MKVLTKWFSITIILAGCAPAYKDVLIEYENAAVCCQSISEFNFQKLRMGELYSYKINNQTPAYQFDEGKSYFLAFELPEYHEPYHVFINSYTLQDWQGPKGRYLFRPQIITLDDSFQVVRRIPNQAWLANRGEWKDVSRAPGSVIFGMEWPFDRLTGQLPITRQNQREKYIVIHTTKILLGEQTTFKPSIIFNWGATPLPSRNSPTGVVLVELLKPSALYRRLGQQWRKSYQEPAIGKRYEGYKYIVTAPPSGDYWVKETTKREDPRSVSRFDFISVEDSGIGIAFAETFYLGLAYSDYAPEFTLDAALREVVKKHNQHLIDAQLTITEDFSVSGARCRRIDLSGKAANALFLPLKGYDIICIHPDWEYVEPPLMIRIGANYGFSLDVLQDMPDGEMPAIPVELSNYYEQVNIIRDN